MVPPPCQACQRALWCYQQWYWRCFLPSSRLPPAWWDIVSGWTTFRNVLWLCMPQNGPLLQNNLKKHCLCRSTWKVIVSREHVWLYFCVAFSIYYSMPPPNYKSQEPVDCQALCKIESAPFAQQLWLNGVCVCVSGVGKHVEQIPGKYVFRCFRYLCIIYLQIYNI